MRRPASLRPRDELTAQNRTKFGRVAPRIATSVVDAGAKDWAGQATFAMAPTLTLLGGYTLITAAPEVSLVGELPAGLFVHAVAVYDACNLARIRTELWRYRGNRA